MSDDLASGFQNVDSASAVATFSSCLTPIDSIPFFAECKRDSYQLLDAAPGHRILEVGCGLGDDAATLASLVAPGGSVVAIDASRTMIEASRQRHGEVAGLSFDVDDAAHLPFDAASFDACRVDRVLQHIADPFEAIREMVRVLRPGGVLVAYDHDLGDIGGRLDRSRADPHRPERLVRPLPVGLDRPAVGPTVAQAGLVDVMAYPKTLVLQELDVADQVYTFFATVGRLAEARVISRMDADGWSDELRTADADGRFFSSYTGFLVAGREPVGPTS